MNFELRHPQPPVPLLPASQGSDLYGKGSDILLIPHIEIVAGQVDGFLLEKRPHSGMSDEELEKLSPTEITNLAILLLGNQRINDFFSALSVWGLFGSVN